jgi:hypothetical protein
MVIDQVEIESKLDMMPTRMVLKNIINHILGWINSLIWYQRLDDQTVTSSNLIIFIYLIKIKYNVVWSMQVLSLKNFQLIFFLDEKW